MIGNIFPNYIQLRWTTKLIFGWWTKILILSMNVSALWKIIQTVSLFRFFKVLHWFNKSNHNHFVWKDFFLQNLFALISSTTIHEISPVTRISSCGWLDCRALSLKRYKRITTLPSHKASARLYRKNPRFICLKDSNPLWTANYYLQCCCCWLEQKSLMNIRPQNLWNLLPRAIKPHVCKHDWFVKSKAVSLLWKFL